MNRIPKSLERPFLRDAIVELWFEAGVKVELLPGVFYERLRHEWSPPKVSPIESLSLGFNVNIEQNAPATFKRQGFTLSVNPTSVVFNVENDYPGWAKAYRPLLTKTLPTLLEGEVVSARRTSIRYVNHVPVDNLFHLINRFEHDTSSGWQPQSQTVRRTLIRSGVKAVINLTTSRNFVDEQDSPYGIIDIALHRPLTRVGKDSTEQLLNYFDELHRFNKEILFGELLPEPFIANFGPVYNTEN